MMDDGVEGYKKRGEGGVSAKERQVETASPTRKKVRRPKEKGQPPVCDL